MTTKYGDVAYENVRFYGPKRSRSYPTAESIERKRALLENLRAEVDALSPEEVQAQVAKLSDPAYRAKQAEEKKARNREAARLRRNTEKLVNLISGMPESFQLEWLEEMKEPSVERLDQRSLKSSA